MDRRVLEVVGRREELAAVEAFLARGSGVCVLAGDAGIGKTTVWRAGLDLAGERSCRVLAAMTAVAEARLAYAALRDLLDGLFDDVEDALPPPQRRALAVALLRADPADLPASPAAVAAGFLGALRVAATAGPLLVAVDDIQWLDASSALALDFAARRVREDPIAFLFSRRTGHEVTTLALERLPPGELSEVEIGSLTLGALHQLLISRLEVALALPALRAVHELSGGNPFYALESPDTPKPFLHETRSIDHNLYIHGSRVYESNYMAGLRILEYDKKSLTAGQLREVAFFDVVPGLDEPEFAGTWSNYRFPGSGITVVSAIENEVSGLFVLRPQLGDDGRGGRPR
jgi:hypothetical protein